MSAAAAVERYDDDPGDGSPSAGRSARTPRRIDRLVSGLPATDRRAAGLQVVHAAGLTGVVRPASAHTPEALGAARVLPVLSELRALLPGGGLRRGATVAVHSSSILLALLVAASKAGSWCAVVGMPALSPIAAAEMGIALDRLALVPHPGTEWTTAVAALLDGVDIVVAAPPGPIAPAVANRLAARARQRGSVLMPAGAWAGADLTIAPVHGTWEGLAEGRGRLRCREMTIQARGRGAASAPREVTLWLPALDGVLPPVTRRDLTGAAAGVPARGRSPRDAAPEGWPRRGRAEAGVGERDPRDAAPEGWPRRGRVGADAPGSAEDGTRVVPLRRVS